VDQRLPQHGAECEDIGAAISGAAAQPLRGGVPGRGHGGRELDAAVALEHHRRGRQRAQRLARSLRRMDQIGRVANHARTAQLVEPADGFGDRLERQAARLTGIGLAQRCKTSGLGRGHALL
jgi:hypothetical protein